MYLTPPHPQREQEVPAQLPERRAARFLHQLLHNQFFSPINNRHQVRSPVRSHHIGKKWMHKGTFTLCKNIQISRLGVQQGLASEDP